MAACWAGSSAEQYAAASWLAASPYGGISELASADLEFHRERAQWVGDKVLGTGAPAAPTAASKTYLVKPLETWETLAQRFYGDSRHAATLQNANRQVPAGSKIRPGTVINVPNMPL